VTIDTTKIPEFSAPAEVFKTAQESEIQTVTGAAELPSITDIEAFDGENDEPATVTKTLPDNGKFVLKENMFKARGAPKIEGRLYEIDAFKILEDPNIDTWIMISFCIPETTRHNKELSAFHIVDAVTLDPNRTEDNDIDDEPKPEPDTSTEVEPVAGAFKPCGSN